MNQLCLPTLALQGAFSRELGDQRMGKNGKILLHLFCQQDLVQDEYTTKTRKKKANKQTPTKPKTKPLGNQEKSSELNRLAPFEKTTFEKIFFRRK